MVMGLLVQYGVSKVWIRSIEGFKWIHRIHFMDMAYPYPQFQEYWLASSMNTALSMDTGYEPYLVKDGVVCSVALNSLIRKEEGILERSLRFLKMTGDNAYVLSIGFKVMGLLVQYGVSKVWIRSIEGFKWIHRIHFMDMAYPYPQFQSRDNGNRGGRSRKAQKYEGVGSGTSLWEGSRLSWGRLPFEDLPRTLSIYLSDFRLRSRDTLNLYPTVLIIVFATLRSSCLVQPCSYFDIILL
ncbi:hypothetical protein Tco_0689143 [Tanacetum coccineum]